VTSRWVWLVAAGLLGLVATGTAASFTARAYESTVSVYVGAARVGVSGDDPANAAQVRNVVLPSVAELARSTGLADQVVRELGLPMSAQALADEITVTTTEGSRLDLAVVDPSPARAVAAAGALGAELQRRAELLQPATVGSLLSVSRLGPATPAQLVSSHLTRSTVLLAAVVGTALAAVLAGLTELRRPRVRSGHDVGRVCDAPVVPLPLASLGRSPRRRPWSTRAGRVHREDQLLLAGSMLRSWAGGGSGRIVVAGATAGSADGFVRDLRPRCDDLDLLPVADPRQIALTRAVAGVVVVADTRRAALGELADAVRAVRSSGRPLLGVVVDGLLPPGARWRDRLRAGAHGDGAWGRALRDTGAAGRPATVATRTVAFAALAALGFTHVLPFALSSGLLVAAALLPLWAPALRRHVGGPLLAVLAGLALAAGVLLSWLASADHGFQLHDALRVGVLVLTAVGGVGLILWARSVLRLPAVGMAYGAGYLLAGLMAVPGSPYPWKFQLSAPVTIIILSLAARRQRPVSTLIAFGVVGLLDVVNDARSAFAFCLLGAVLVLWQARPRRPGATRRPRVWIVFPVLAGLAGGVYSGLSWLMQSGALGAQIQQRTLAQIAESGSLLLSGRPEWAATWALMRFRPQGFGLGVQPTARDEVVARAGLSVTHVPTVNSYLDHQLFDGGVQLHSIVADLWASLGPLGALLGLVMGGLVVAGLGDRLPRRAAPGLICWLVPQVLWSLAFGPFASDGPALVLALGLLLVARSPAAGPEVAPAAQPALPTARPAPAAVPA
jgi:capsular polysaccharide biosynthesis protein